MRYKKARKYLIFALFATTVPFLALLGEASLGNTSSILLVLGSIAGFVGTVLLFWQVMLGLRFISSKFSKDLVWLNKLHKTIGTYGLLLIFTHPFLKAITYSGSISLVFFPDLSDPLWLQISFGRVALLLLLLIWFTSIYFRKRLGFRVWKYIHFSAYLVLFLIFFHAAPIGTYLNTYPFLEYFWNTLSMAFYAIALYRLYKLLGFGYARYELIQKERMGDVFVYTFKALDKTIVPMAGQFSYIKIRRVFGEEHPFTVMGSEPEERELVFGIKVEGKYTQKLSQLDPGSVVLMDGPYGIYTLEGHNQEPKVIIAGGIGVTPFVDLVKHHGNENTYMFNANRTLGSAVKRDRLKEKLGERYVDVISDEEISGENIINGYLNEDLVRKHLPDKIIREAVYFICGSQPFYRNYRDMLLKMGVQKDAIFYEEFGL